MNEIKQNDFILFDNIKDDPFFHYIDLLSTFHGIEPPCSYNEYYDYLDNIISNLALATNYTFENALEKKLFVYALFISTYENKPFGHSPRPTDDEIYDILKIKLNSSVRVYCAYLFFNGIINSMISERNKNCKLFITLISKSTILKEEYDKIKKCISLLKNDEEE